MTQMIRNVVWLICTVVFFFIVLGVLLWGRHVATKQHTVHLNQFLAPSQNHIARAQRAIVALQNELNSGRDPPSESANIVRRFNIVGTLDSLQQHIVAVVRLTHIFDYQGAFNLPSRAHRQLESVSSETVGLAELTPGNTARLLALLDPLRDTLDQIDRIYQLDQHRSTEAYGKFVERSLVMVLAAIGVLVLASTPLMIRLTSGLRDSVRRESRARNDLEEAKQNLEVMAMYDGLTGLGNRHLFKTRLDQATGSAKRSSAGDAWTSWSTTPATCDKSPSTRSPRSPGTALSTPT